MFDLACLVAGANPGPGGEDQTARPSVHQPLRQFQPKPAQPSSDDVRLAGVARKPGSGNSGSGRWLATRVIPHLIVEKS